MIGKSIFIMDMNNNMYVMGKIKFIIKLVSCHILDHAELDKKLNEGGRLVVILFEFYLLIAISGTPVGVTHV